MASLFVGGGGKGDNSLFAGTRAYGETMRKERAFLSLFKKEKASSTIEKREMDIKIDKYPRETKTNEGGK